MSSRSLYIAFALGIPLTMTAKHILDVYRRISPVPLTRIASADSVPNSLIQSSAVREHVNPNNHVQVEDSRFIDVIIPPDRSAPADEAVLAQFIRGFFGGRVFAPERSLLRMLRRTLTYFPSIKVGTATLIIWSVDDLPPSHLLPPHTLLFGGFQIADISLDHHPSETGSHIDLIFGSGNGTFAGVHRFQVSHPSSATVIRIQYDHISCNPTVNTALKPDFLQVLHKIYAMWLFREGVGEIKRNLALK